MNRGGAGRPDELVRGAGGGILDEPGGSGRRMCVAWGSGAVAEKTIWASSSREKVRLAGLFFFTLCFYFLPVLLILSTILQNAYLR